MSAYINTLTQEYPLYPGDMQLRFVNFDEANPPEGWAVVPDINPPDITANQIVEELAPILIDGVWTKQFVITEMTQTQIDERDRFIQELRRNSAPNTNQPGSAPDVIE